jgi:hypothetical protein
MLDKIIIVFVATILLLDQIFIRDPLHLLLGLVMLPPLFRLWKRRNASKHVEPTDGSDNKASL